MSTSTAIPQDVLADALAAGKLVVTYTGDPTGHITIQFKGWKKGDRRRIIPVNEADRIYVNDTSRSWGEPGYGVGVIRMEADNKYRGMLFNDDNADPTRVAAARYIWDAVQGKGPTDDILPSTNCVRCGANLKDPVSIQRHVGPECFGKVTGSQQALRVEGFNWPEAPAEAAAKPVAASQEPHVTLDAAGDFVVDFQGYKPAAIQALKDAIGYKERSYDKENKLWTVENSGVNGAKLKGVMDAHGLTASEEATWDIEESVERRSELGDYL